MTSSASSGRVAFLAFTLSFVMILANGRAIGSGDTNAVEKTAVALVERSSFLLPDEGPLDPFTRRVEGGRISIYPSPPALLATPFFLASSVFFELNVAGQQAAGKLTAAFVASGAVALLAWAFAQRTTPLVALGSALVVGLGTTIFSTAQALWQHPFSVFFLVLAIVALERRETAPTVEAGRGPALLAALALSLTLSSRPATLPLCLVLFGFLLVRARPHAIRILLVAAIPLVFVAIYNHTFFGAPWRVGPQIAGRFGLGFPESIAGLLISPARGLLIFTPIAILGLWGLIVQSKRTALASALLLAAAAHFTFIAFWNEWHGGESFGPRLLTDLIPALFYFLPEAVTVWPKAGSLLGLLSCGIQFLGGWTYDYRWERLHQRGLEFGPALWSVRDSPLVFALREGVVIQGLPRLEDRRVRLPQVRFTPFGPQGSSVDSTDAGLRVTGEPLFRDVRLERGARITSGAISLAHPADALAFRSLFTGSRKVRLVGALQGLLQVQTDTTAVEQEVSGAFDVEVAVSLRAGEDVYVRAGSGELQLTRIEIR